MEAAYFPKIIRRIHVKDCVLDITIVSPIRTTIMHVPLMTESSRAT
jgi:hypothetical protein